MTVEQQRGQATVELALLLPFLMVLVLTVVQVGLVWRDQILVTHAAREAARAAAVDPSHAVAFAAAVDSADVDPARLDVQLTGVGGATVTVRVTIEPVTSLPVFSTFLAGRSVSASVTMLAETAASDDYERGWGVT